MIIIEYIEKVRLSANIKARFRSALIANRENAEVILNKAVLNYVEKHEEDAAAKKLHEIADQLKTKKATYSNS